MKKTCLGLDCPERKSICCNAMPYAIVADEGTSYFACKQCKKEFVGGECNAVSNADWEEVFRKFYDDNEYGGSSRWLVVPSTVKSFIKGLLTKYV